MTEHISDARRREQKQLWRINLLQVLIMQVTRMAPIGCIVAMFSLYVGVRKEPLTAAVAFTTLYLVNTLRSFMGAISYSTRASVSAWISLKRLDRYFSSTTPVLRHPEGPLRIQEATFRRNKTASFCLRDVSIDFVEDGLNVVMGQSGSGKTTLLLSILGETILENGRVMRPRDVAFATQTPWLENATVRENIIFHSEFEQARYDRVIEACCLPADFNELTDGDMTEPGEGGASLSGGQRSRVALARALYSKAPLLLLDDVFSALDSKTAAALWENCFCHDVLRGRTVVLVTNVPWIAGMPSILSTSSYCSLTSV